MLKIWWISFSFHVYFPESHMFLTYEPCPFPSPFTCSESPFTNTVTFLSVVPILRYLFMSGRIFLASPPILFQVLISDRFLLWISKRIFILRLNLNSQWQKVKLPQGISLQMLFFSSTPGCSLWITDASWLLKILLKEFYFNRQKACGYLNGFYIFLYKCKATGQIHN